MASYGLETYEFYAVAWLNEQYSRKQLISHTTLSLPSLPKSTHDSNDIKSYSFRKSYTNFPAILSMQELGDFEETAAMLYLDKKKVE